MDVFDFEGRLIQVDEVSDVSEDGMVFECWDVSPGVDRGLLFTVLQRPGGYVVRPEMTELPVDLLIRGLRQVGATSD